MLFAISESAPKKRKSGPNPDRQEAQRAIQRRKCNDWRRKRLREGFHREGIRGGEGGWGETSDPLDVVGLGP